MRLVGEFVIKEGGGAGKRQRLAILTEHLGSPRKSG